MTKFITVMVLWISILSNPLFPQNTNKSTDPPSNLTYSVLDQNDVQLIWEAPSSGGGETNLHWDGDNADAFGFFMGAEHFKVAAKWNPEHLTSYDGYTINKMRFFVVNDSPTLVLKIYTGEDGTEVYTQNITSFNINEWTEVVLDTPVSIDSGSDLWAVLDIDMPSGGMVMGGDAGPAINGNGDLIEYQGTWYTGAEVGFDFNWNIRLVVQESKKSSEELLGYNVYRDDAVLNENPISTTSYVDENLSNGVYEYFVTAIYNEGESTASNTVAVTISQEGVIEADSLALVDLYNACNGTNWNSQDYWLTGPIGEWAGVQIADNRVVGLSLSGNNVTGVFPESFGNLDGMLDISMSQNEITGLPESFGNLINMTRCWIGWNPLSSLPVSFGNLDSLEELHIGYTELGELPESFGNLDNLNWLGLGDAGLNSLPSTFGNLSSLQHCFIWGNSLTELPASFGELESLFYLTLDQNQLTSLSENFGDLDNLSHLNIEDNLLQELPASFGDLASLDSLLLAQNQLISLPENFGNLADLIYLRLSLNKLTSFPESMVDLATIQVILADQNQIESLPENIGDLGNTLHLLGLSNNNISKLPSSIGEMDVLYELYATNNKILELPESIGDMDVLEVLALDNNLLSTVPSSLADITALGYLGVMNNQIEELPESFGNLQCDTLLMTGNMIKELPANLANQTLDYLWVDDNNLQFGSIEPFIGQINYDFLYNDQGMVGVDTIVDVQTNGDLNYTIEVSGENNTYQWYKDGSSLEGQTTNTLMLTEVNADDLATYVLKINNTLVTDLELVSYNMELNLLTGTEIVEPSEFTVYPNPTTNGNLQITLDDNAGSAELEMHNMAGQVVINQAVQSNVSTVNLYNLEKGLYIAKVKYKNGEVQVKKIVLN